MGVEDEGNAGALIEVSQERCDGSISVSSENLSETKNQLRSCSARIDGKVETYTSTDHLLVVTVTARSSTTAGGRNTNFVLIEFRGEGTLAIADGRDGEGATGGRETDSIRRNSTAQHDGMSDQRFMRSAG